MRRPAYLQPPAHGRDRWMISYLDVMTILLILFVAIAARAMQSSRHPVAPARANSSNIATTYPVAAKEPNAATVKPVIDANLAKIQKELEYAQQPAASGSATNQPGLPHLDVQMRTNSLVVDLPQALLFAPGDDRISESALPVVSAVGGVLRNISNRIVLIGHSDSAPIHNQRFRDNWELAAARGLRLRQLLSTRFGIAESRLRVESVGANDPQSSNDTASGRANNRRVEIVIEGETPPLAPTTQPKTQMAAR